MRSVADLHEDWLTQVETEGPFLALPVIKDIWPQGVERLGDIDDRMLTFKQAFVTWQHEVDAFAFADRTPEAKERYATVTRAWVETVLDDLAGWGELRIPANQLPSTMEIRSPGEHVAVRPSGALKGRDSDYGALLLISEPTTSLRDTGLDGWAANEIDRMAMLLRKAQVEVGIVTDGQWWAIVWAKDGKPTGSGMVNALTWAEEPLLRDAFLTLIDQRRFRAKDAEQRLPRLFERSELEAEEITEALGTQVRRSVELLMQAFFEARLAAARNGDPDPLAEDPDEVYQAAVTVMMRVVFLLFAEEREMLPTEQLYWDSYAIRDLLTDLKQHAANGEEPLDESFDAWHRLLAVSQALYDGVNYDEMRMPAYGGSLLDPDRFPWLYATVQRGLRLKVSDRVMLHVLQSVQTAVVRGEQRRVSFRDVDVEQIGYIYEGLLGYSCAVVEDQVILGLVGKEGEEPEIDADTLQGLYNDNPGATKFTAALLDWIKTNQPAAKPLTPAQMKKLYDAEIDEADMRRLLTPIAGLDEDLLGFLIDWSNYIRRDLRGIPLVVPIGGLTVVETPSRKNAGAHYTPRSLAEEVVLHALQPLVYDPGPLQTNDENAWRLKSSSAILDLKVADIAAGSGAFLVAAARYLADRVTEAWIAEGSLDPEQGASPQLAKDRAIREVIARCLYGADINPMAVEMCKLSLWLVSMDKTKPFSFVDDKIFCGNSLLGVTSLDQLRYLHIYPESNSVHAQLLFDIDGKIAEATRLRNELASPVEEHDPMRSTRGKLALLEQLRQVTADLRLIADGIIATGLPVGGKPGRQLDDAYGVLSLELGAAFPADGSVGDLAKVKQRIQSGLTPTVDTDYKRWKPLHWAVEAADVVVGRGGFDAIVGNPPFLVAKNISGALGSDVREQLTNVVAHGRTGKADLAAFFLLRAVELLRAASGQIGFLMPKSVSEGDTRVVSLDQLDGRITVRRSVRSRRWPTTGVTVWIALIWLTSPKPGALLECDGALVAAIASSLEPAGRVGGKPQTIDTTPRAYKGSVLQGDGFLIAKPEAAALLVDPRNAQVVKPYLNGSMVNAGRADDPDFWAIDFREMDESQARGFSEAWRIVETRVYPERSQIDRSKYPRMVDQWWKHWNTRVEMYDQIRPRRWVWVIAAVSKHAAPVLVSSDSVLSSNLVVFDSNDLWLFGVLASSVHRSWVARWGSTMQTDIRYAPSDLWVTFPVSGNVSQIANLSEDLLDARQELMRTRGLGLTQAMSLIDDPTNVTSEVLRYRSALVAVDRALLALYGWRLGDDIHDFVEYRNVMRYWFRPEVRVDLLDRLLELNHERARAVGQDVPEQGALV